MTATAEKTAPSAEPTLGPELTPEIRSWLDKRATAIRLYNELDAEATEHRAHGRKALALSCDAKKSIQSARIGNAQMELEAEGHVVKPWQKPSGGAHKSKRLSIPQSQIEADVAKYDRVRRETANPDVKDRASKKIDSLLKAAKVRGYEVKDPR